MVVVVVVVVVCVCVCVCVCMLVFRHNMSQCVTIPPHRVRVRVCVCVQASGRAERATKLVEHCVAFGGEVTHTQPPRPRRHTRTARTGRLPVRDSERDAEKLRLRDKE